jgi:hypothetical protein
MNQYKFESEVQLGPPSKKYERAANFSRLIGVVGTYILKKTIFRPKTPLQTAKIYDLEQERQKRLEIP